MIVTGHELSLVIKSILSLSVFVVLTFWMWPMQRMYLFRQQMFAIRDELWDFAADGGISFEDPAYMLLRQLFNGLIRYAHNLTPYRFIMSFLRWKFGISQPTTEWTVSWNNALAQVSDEQTKKILTAFHSRATDLVIGQLLLSPTILIACVLLSPIFALVIFFYAHWTNLRSIYRDLMREIPMSFLEEEAAKAT